MGSAKFRVLLTSTLALSASAFHISFFSEGLCTERILGTWVGGKNEGCRQEFAGVAASASVNITGPVDDNTYVQFYSSNDCSPGTETSSSEDDCVIIDGPDIDFYRSFRVVDDVVTPPLDANVTLIASDESASPTPAPTESFNRLGRHRERGVESDIDISGSTQPKMYHGKRAHIDGIDYVWHQVYDGGFTGVRADEWDPEKHVEERRSLEELTASAGIQRKRSTIPGTSPVPPNVLEERQDQSLKCLIQQTCTRAILTGAIGLQKLLLWSVDDAKDFATAQGKDLWAFFRDPFIQQFTAQYLANIASQQSQRPEEKNLPNPPAQHLTIVIQMVGNQQAINTCPTDTTPTGDLATANDRVANTLQTIFIKSPQKENTIAVEYVISPSTNTNPKKRGALLEPRAPSFLSLRANAMFCTIAFSGELCKLTTGLCTSS